MASVSRPLGLVLLLQPFGTTKALTPESRHLALRSPCLSHCIFPTFRLQPRCVPRHRFTRHNQRAGRVSDFAMNEQARRYTPPNRVRYPADRQFASGCSPPHFAVTQLPSATGPWLTLTQTFTVLTQRLHRRTHPGLDPGSMFQLYCFCTQSRYAPLCTWLTHSGLARYHSMVLRMPVSKVSDGFQPSSASSLRASMA